MEIENKKEKEESLPAIIAAVAGNVIVGLVKFIAFIISGSSAMLAESIHSVVDSANGILVAVGLKAAKKKPDLEHPFGHGKNLYFYSFIVALLIFILGGLISIGKGILAIMQQTPLGDPTINYIVCILAIIVEGTSFTIAWRTAKRMRGNIGIFKYIKEGKDPSAWTVLFEDSAAELGLLVALLGIFLSQITGNAIFDASASIVIGLILISVALVLMKETKSLLIGEGLSAKEVEKLCEIIEEQKYVRCCGQILSLYMGPKDLILNIDVSFIENVSDAQVLKTIDKIETNIRTAYPEANRIFIETENLANTVRQKTYQKELIEEAEEADK